MHTVSPCAPGDQPEKESKKERKKERIDTGEPSNDEARPKTLFFQGADIP